jgi:hypothetical protein
MTMIEGLTQAIRYGVADQRLHFKLRHEGSEAQPDLTGTYTNGRMDLSDYTDNIDSILEFNTAGVSALDWTLQIEETGSDSISVNSVLKQIYITFDDGVTTVADVETLIGTLAGGDDVVDVLTPGTAGSVLTAADDQAREAVFTLGDGRPSVTIFNPAGDQVLAITELTKVSGNQWWYVDVDATGTTVWDIGFNYRAQIDFYVGAVPVQDNVMVDVIMWPFNETLITTEEIDRLHPAWSGKRPNDWQDWTEAIEMAHLKVARDLRNLQDSHGSYVYPSQILDRSQVRMIALAYTEEQIAESIRMRDEVVTKFNERSVNALENFNRFLMDVDDDMIADDNAGTLTGPTFNH